MFHCLSPRYLVLSILLVGSWCNLGSCDDDEAEEEAAPEPDLEPVPEPRPNSSEEKIKETHTSNANDGCLVPAEDTKEKCCKLNFNIDDDFMRCYNLHKKNMPRNIESKKNKQATTKFATCFVECFYKTKKYIGRGDSLNMKIVKADADKIYKGQADKAQHYVKMYEHCQRHGKLEFGAVKSNPATRVVLKGTCKPYFLFVLTCASQYGKISCPYYTWLNHKEFKVECEELKAKCEETHG